MQSRQGRTKAVTQVRLDPLSVALYIQAIRVAISSAECNDLVQARACSRLHMCGTASGHLPSRVCFKLFTNSWNQSSEERWSLVRKAATVRELCGSRTRWSPEGCILTQTRVAGLAGSEAALSLPLSLPSQLPSQSQQPSLGPSVSRGISGSFGGTVGLRGAPSVSHGDRDNGLGLGRGHTISRASLSVSHLTLAEAKDSGISSWPRS